MGLGRKANQVYLIDFGLAKRYRDANTNRHIPYRYLWPWFIILCLPSGGGKLSYLL